MRVVNIRDLKVIKYLNEGSFSRVYLIEFNGIRYAYKEFKHVYPYIDPNVLDRIGKFTEIEFPSGYFPPLYIVEEEFTKLGYLTEYNPELEEILDCFERDEIIVLQKSAKKRLDFLHNDLKFIHGDAHFGNILCNRDDLTTYILDFDFSNKVGTFPAVIDDYKEVAQDYLKSYSYDEKIDAYLFNISTLHILSKKDYYDDYFLLDAIDNDNYDIPEMNKDIKRLSKELLLRDTRKPYSGEYIVDYL